MRKPGDDIQDRLLDFAADVGILVEELPKTLLGRHIAGQFIRCGTAPAFYYAEARSAESRRDFIHKLAICLKELEESNVCLLLIRKAKLRPPERVRGMLRECEELRKIIGKSISTSKARLAKDSL